MSLMSQDLAMDNTQSWRDVCHQQHTNEDHCARQLQKIGRIAARRYFGISSEIHNPDEDDRRMMAYTMRSSGEEALRDLASENILPRYDIVVIGAVMRDKEDLPALARHKGRCGTSPGLPYVFEKLAIRDWEHLHVLHNSQRSHSSNGEHHRSRVFPYGRTG